VSVDDKNTCVAPEPWEPYLTADLRPCELEEFELPPMIEFDGDGEDEPEPSPPAEQDRVAPETISMAPARPLAGKGTLVANYNRLGGLMGVYGELFGIDVAAALAVWTVETGPYTHTPGRAIIRFENHLLWGEWGKKNAALYDRHFRHGGRGGVAGQPWHNHAFRVDGTWTVLHPKAQSSEQMRKAQLLEYEAVALATRLAGENVAIGCCSIGGPQILLRNHALLGYPSRKAMWNDFQGSEESHVRGLFTFFEKKNLFGAIRAGDWDAVARTYNGPGQVEIYSPKLQSAYAAAAALLMAGGK
jgi:hypothetical protein